VPKRPRQRLISAFEDDIDVPINYAIIATIDLTGARDNALRSMQLEISGVKLAIELNTATSTSSHNIPCEPPVQAPGAMDTLETPHRLEMEQSQFGLELP
jgi:hypothetical protein